MKLLQDYASPLPGLLKDQRLQEGESYRLMHFVVQLPVEEGLLLYNVMTRAVVLLTPEEARSMTDNPASVPELVAKWFAVPSNHDDRKLAREVRAVGRMLEKRPEGLSGFTILTTTDCNARCFYCYEKGRSRVSMKEETALKVSEFIIRNHAAGIRIRLLWFGGEPLYNKGVISLICGKLRCAGIDYQSSMISNGYLFDDKTVSEAIDLWNLRKVQITLDGTEEVYNRSKAFVSPETSPYRRVLSNIHGLLDAGVKVSIRLNIGRHNADDLIDLADILTHEFGGRKLLGVYSHTLFEAGAEMESAHTDSRHQELFDARMKLQEKLREGKIAQEGSLPDQLKLNRCMADRDADVVILPDGRLGKCEHYSEDHCFGSIDSPERDDALLAEFKRLREELDACADCSFYPDCYRLTQCEEAAHCYPEEREEKRLTILRNLSDFYRKKKDEVPD